MQGWRAATALFIFTRAQRAQADGVASTPLIGRAKRVDSLFIFTRAHRAKADGFASTPLIGRAKRVEKSRPLSRVLSWAVIPLGCASPRSSSDLPGSPCGPHVAAKTPLASLFGLAPGGVCRAADVATRAVRSYRTISPLPSPLARRLGGIFLLHFPWARAPQALPGTVPCGARTFLHVLAHTATAWPTLRAHHTPVSAAAPACTPRSRALR